MESFCKCSSHLAADLEIDFVKDQLIGFMREIQKYPQLQIPLKGAENGKSAVIKALLYLAWGNEGSIDWNSCSKCLGSAD
jgi:hypothetical protein